MPFVLSTRCTCVLIMPFNQFLDKQHLSGGWIILAKEKCSLTGMCTTFERNKLLCIWNISGIFLFQLIKHGTNTLHSAFIFLFRVYITFMLHFLYRIFDQLFKPPRPTNAQGLGTGEPILYGYDILLIPLRFLKPVVTTLPVSGIVVII